MAQYKFTKSYSAVVTVGGVVGRAPKSFNVGDVFEGTPVSNGIQIRIAPHSQFNEGAPSNVSYQEFLIVPNEYLELKTDYLGLTSPSSQIFTQRNIIVGLAIVVILILILN